MKVEFLINYFLVVSTYYANKSDNKSKQHLIQLVRIAKESHRNKRRSLKSCSASISKSRRHLRQVERLWYTASVVFLPNKYHPSRRIEISKHQNYRAQLHFNDGTDAISSTLKCRENDALISNDHRKSQMHRG